jgi:hypothetical protein
MAVSRPRKAQRVPIRAQKARRLGCRHDSADLRDGDPRLRCRCAERWRRLRRDRAEDLVVLAAGKDRLDQGGVGADSGTRATSISADTPEVRQSFAKSATSPSDMSIAADACARTTSASALRGCGNR